MAGGTADIADLIARVSLRDRAAFSQLYSRTSAKLFGVTLRILGNRAEAEEALQEIFIKVWHRAEAYKSGAGSPMTWLITIARNHAIDIIRARKPAPADLDAAETVPDPAMSPEQAAINAGEGARIEDCLSELKDGRADAVKGAYVNGDSYEELAERFAVPLNTMRTWLRRSLLQLRECLER
jgi:RNA polymerase sigma-70 factor, ECF subfamily